jgi:hypothetical protein
MEQLLPAGPSVKPPVEEMTVSVIVVVAVVVPEVPVMVTVYVPTVAEAVAVNVSTLVVVVGLVPYATVTPLGRPVAARVTLPVNAPTSVTVMVSVAVLPWVTDSVGAEGASVKPGLAVTVSAMVVVALNEPEVPVMVTVAAPTVAVALAVSVSTLVEVVGLVANAAVMPVGRPDAVRVTEPVNGLTSVTVIVSVPLAPCAIDRVDAERESVKLPPVVTVRVKVALTTVLPEVPVMVGA